MRLGFLLRPALGLCSDAFFGLRPRRLGALAWMSCFMVFFVVGLTDCSGEKFSSWPD
jgi:hypothetical protein